jgi:ketosteroid isomerase-like protein
MNKDNDVKAITRKFFAAYYAHDVDGMLALCADGAQGRYLPYGKKSLMPIRGGLEQIWRGLLGAVPDFGVEVDEMIQAEGHIVVVQALLGGAMPGGCPWSCNERQVRSHRSRLYHPLRRGRQNHASGLLLGQHRHQRHQGERFVRCPEKPQ